MHDIRAIRDDPERFDQGVALRGLSPMSSELLALDEKRRSVVTQVQDLQNRRNAASKEIGMAKGQGDETRANALMAEVAGIRDKMPALEEAERVVSGELDDLLMGIPNIPDADVPVGVEEGANAEVRKSGTPGSYDFEPKQHFDLGEDLGLLDFERAAKLSGARFAILRGQLARLDRAIANFMLDTHTSEFGYIEVIPPFLVRSSAMAGTGQLPKFGEDLFCSIRGDTEAGDAELDDKYWLIPTAEVPLTNLVADEIIDAGELPMRVTAWTPCFRAEAGSAGRDTRGLIRMHQFSKVELVSITVPEESEAELDRMTACAENILKRLELPFRTMILSTGDMGFGAAKTFDLEVWLPGQNAYREISSCSNCRDFQARRMKARYRPAGEKGTRFVNTLNGSGLAVGRTLVAILENYQQTDGTVVVPDVLQPYMGGVRVIGE